MTKSLPPKNIVLYADDDPDDLLLICEVFQKESPNTKLVTFEDGASLVSHLTHLLEEGMMPCLVILDINMPRLDGKQTLKMIREIKDLEDLPVVLFSTSTLPAEAAFAQMWSAGFITKPLNQEQIDQVFDQLIAHCPDEVKRRINHGRNTKGKG